MEFFRLADCEHQKKIDRYFKIYTNKDPVLPTAVKFVKGEKLD